MAELGPAASELLEQHLTLTREWFPDELIPFDRGRVRTASSIVVSLNRASSRRPPFARADQPDSADHPTTAAAAAAVVGQVVFGQQIDHQSACRSPAALPTGSCTLRCRKWRPAWRTATLGGAWTQQVTTS